MGNQNSETPIPNTKIDQIVSLTLRSNSSNQCIKKRDNILEEYNYVARVRQEDDTLVLYPKGWLDEEGKVDLSIIEDTNRAIERSLGGVDKNADWDEIEKQNSKIVSQIHEDYSEEHAKNVRAFADFMGNYYLKKITEATEDEKKQFKNEYYVRNVWSGSEQESILEESLELLENEQISD